MDKGTLIRALRCSASVPDKNHSCEGCPYRGLDEVTEEAEKLFGENIDEHLVKIKEKKYWEYCNTEKMALDAAEMLEKTK